MAKFLYDVDGIDKGLIGEFLGKDKELSHQVNSVFFSLFPFNNMVIDMAFRTIFKKIRLPKESQ